MKSMLMRALSLVVLFVISTLAVSAQQKVSTYTNQKFRVTKYGEYQQSSTAQPTVVQVNLETGTITVETSSDLISSFMDYTTTQHIRGTQSLRAGMQGYVTEEGWVFSFDARSRLILITKEGTNFKMHALWLDEVTFR